MHTPATPPKSSVPVASADSRGNSSLASWISGAWLFIALGFGIRLLFIGLGELIPEEAYYWQFSRRLDWSYLDHPPMIAWLIYLGTSVFGHNEFGVRIGSYLCSVLAAGFIYKLAQLLFGTERAIATLLLFALLPYFFMNGFLATPDAPLVLFWSASLLFLVRALRDQQNSAWIWAGAAMGLGMLSKYTMALNGLAAVLFLILHRPSRRWFLSPYPYLGALLSTAIFTPVLYWNSQHNWISFGFQTSRRLQENTEFSLHVLALHIILLLTPAGIAALWISLRKARQTTDSDFLRYFLLAYALTPIAVFFFFSIRHEPKPNWTGPAFLAALPFIAATLLPSFGAHGKIAAFTKGAWRPTLVVLVALYSVTLTYFCVGLPGIGYTAKSQRYVGWRDLGLKVASIRAQLAGEIRGEPVVVAMDKHFVGSELAFYLPGLDGQRPIESSLVMGRSVFDMDSLMWQLWDRRNIEGATLLLVARGRSDLEKPELAGYVERLSPISEIITTTRGSASGRFYYRVAYGYRRPAVPASAE